ANQLRAVQIDAKRILDECSQRKGKDASAMRLEVVPPIQQHSNTVGVTVPLGGVKTTLVDVDEHSVRIKIFNVDINIPFALISACWRNSRGEPAISLNARVVRGPGGNDYYLDIP